jgi:hypothetical protein
MFVEIHERKWRSYFYIGRFIDPKLSLFGLDFVFSEKIESDNSWNLQPIEGDSFVPVSLEEEKKLQKVFSDPDNEMYFTRIEKATKKIPILKEGLGFQRGKSEKEIKDLLGEWKPGKLVINPYTNIVYVFIKEWVGKNDMEVFSLGHLRNIGSAKKVFFQKYKKVLTLDWGRTNFKSKNNLRTLNDEELRFVKPSIDLEYINKVKENFGVNVIL